MIKKKNLKKICFALALPFAFIGAGFMGGAATMVTDGAGANYKQDHITPVSIYGSSFNDGVSGEYSQSIPGWEEMAEYKDSNALALIINTGDNFDRYNSNYYIANNPHKTDDDDRILMLNSRKTLAGDNVSRKLAYKTSNDITLNANSYYRLRVDTLSSDDGKSQGEYDVKASVYVEGLKDAEGKAITLGYEGLNNTSWATYYFYIATGSEAQTVNLELYLGGRENRSTGVVFFDKICLEQFSENTFFNAAMDNDYNFVDSTDVHTTTPKFLIDKLQDEESDKEYRLDMTGYNFNFEENDDDNFSILGDAWQSTITSKSHAWIMPVVRNAQPEYFREQTMSPENPTGYDYVGSDLSFDKTKGEAGENANALVLFTDGESHVSVKSKDITLKAHGIYKFSLRVKASELRGDLTLSIKETEQIYDWYNIKSFYPTLASKTKTISSTTSEDLFHNSYATVDMYVKCHNEYDTKIYLEIALGSEENPAEGCVFIDNITLSQIDSASFPTDNDALTMKVATESPDFTNSYFDFTENETAKLTYPLKAQNYVANAGKNTDSGVLYLKDEAHFNEMYSSYDWKGSFPKHPEGSSSVNNVYMMHNWSPTYQSLETPSKTLSAGAWHELSFDYRTITQTDKAAEITLEIVDTNGMQIFYQKGIASYDWTKMKVYVKTNELVPLDVKMIVHFGQDKTGEEMQGYVYLDNFNIKSDVTLPEVAPYKVDLTDVFSLDPNGKIGEGLTLSEALTFDKGSTGEGLSAEGGIVNGQKNQFDITTEEGNILALISFVESKPTLTSKFAYSLAENGYYELSFDLQTNFTADEDAIKENNKNHKCEYGVSVGLKDFSEISQLKSNGKFTHYTIYIKGSSSAVTTNLVFALNSDCYETTGAGYLANVKLTPSTELDFTSAKDNKEEFGKTVFTSTYQNQTPEEPEQPENPTTPTDNTQLWVIIPSIFTAIALIGALVAVAFSKLKFNKREKVTGEEYDRKINVNHDAILIKAQNERDNEAKEIREAIKALNEEREALELSHKEAIKASRQSGKGVTKEAEKEFKAYAGKMARLNEKENILKEQLDTTLSADYLISIEKRLADEEERELRELERVQAGKKSKLAQKEKQDEDK